MKKGLIEKKGLVSDKSKIMVFYYKPDGIRTSVTGLFKEITDEGVSLMNKYQLVTFKFDEIVGISILDSRRSKEV